MSSSSAPAGVLSSVASTLQIPIPAFLLRRQRAVVSALGVLSVFAFFFLFLLNLTEISVDLLFFHVQASIGQRQEDTQRAVGQGDRPPFTHSTVTAHLMDVLALPAPVLALCDLLCQPGGV